mmetsp:Transcript_40164/g.94419  ORF Transcript_40164/g.94419 Transcript_40164/m.94419 type:complete len:1135 (-) Transcript_40164:269-3673(-)
MTRTMPLQQKRSGACPPPRGLPLPPWYNCSPNFESNENRTDSDKCEERNEKLSVDANSVDTGGDGEDAARSVGPSCASDDAHGSDISSENPDNCVNVAEKESAIDFMNDLLPEIDKNTNSVKDCSGENLCFEDESEETCQHQYTDPFDIKAFDHIEKDHDTFDHGTHSSSIEKNYCTKQIDQVDFFDDLYDNLEVNAAMASDSSLLSPSELTNDDKKENVKIESSSNQKQEDHEDDDTIPTAEVRIEIDSLKMPLENNLLSPPAAIGTDTAALLVKDMELGGRSFDKPSVTVDPYSANTAEVFTGEESTVETVINAFDITEGNTEGTELETRDSHMNSTNTTKKDVLPSLSIHNCTRSHDKTTPDENQTGDTKNGSIPKECDSETSRIEDDSSQLKVGLRDGVTGGDDEVASVEESKDAALAMRQDSVAKNSIDKISISLEAKKGSKINDSDGNTLKKISSTQITLETPTSLSGEEKSPTSTTNLVKERVKFFSSKINDGAAVPCPKGSPSHSLSNSPTRHVNVYSSQQHKYDPIYYSAGRLGKDGFEDAAHWANNRSWTGPNLYIPTCKRKPVIVVGVNGEVDDHGVVSSLKLNHADEGDKTNSIGSQIAVEDVKEEDELNGIEINGVHVQHDHPFNFWMKTKLQNEHNEDFNTAAKDIPPPVEEIGFGTIVDGEKIDPGITQTTPFDNIIDNIRSKEGTENDFSVFKVESKEFDAAFSNLPPFPQQPESKSTFDSLFPDDALYSNRSFSEFTSKKCTERKERATKNLSRTMRSKLILPSDLFVISPSAAAYESPVFMPQCQAKKACDFDDHDRLLRNYTTDRKYNSTQVGRPKKSTENAFDSCFGRQQNGDEENDEREEHLLLSESSSMGQDDSPLQVLSSGPIQMRMSMKSIFLKTWRNFTWIRYGSTTIIFFRSERDKEKWLRATTANQSDKAGSHNSLIKLKVDLNDDVGKDDITGFWATEINSKYYPKGLMHNFKLYKWIDVVPSIGPSMVAAFGSDSIEDVILLRRAIVECAHNSRIGLLENSNDFMESGQADSGVPLKLTSTSYGRINNSSNSVISKSLGGSTTSLVDSLSVSPKRASSCNDHQIDLTVEVEPDLEQEQELAKSPSSQVSPSMTLLSELGSPGAFT